MSIRASEDSPVPTSVTEGYGTSLLQSAFPTHGPQWVSQHGRSPQQPEPCENPARTLTRALRFFPSAAPLTGRSWLGSQVSAWAPRSLPTSDKPGQPLSQDDASSPLWIPDPGDHQGFCISAPQKGTQEKERPEVA